MKKIILVASLFVVGLLHVKAQILKPVKWSYGTKRLSKTEGVIFLRATIDEDWHIYSQTVPDGGPAKTSFDFIRSKDYTLAGPTLEPKPISRFEKVFGIEVAYFEKTVTFQQKVKLNVKGPVTIKGTLEYMTCNDEKCLPPEQVPFSVVIQ